MKIIMEGEKKRLSGTRLVLQVWKEAKEELSSEITSEARLVSPKASLSLLRAPVGLTEESVAVWNLLFYQGIVLSSGFGCGQSYLQNFCTGTGKAQGALGDALMSLCSSGWRSFRDGFIFVNVGYR